MQASAIGSSTMEIVRNSDGTLVVPVEAERLPETDDATDDDARRHPNTRVLTLVRRIRRALASGNRQRSPITRWRSRLRAAAGSDGSRARVRSPRTTRRARARGDRRPRRVGSLLHVWSRRSSVELATKSQAQGGELSRPQGPRSRRILGRARQVRAAGNDAAWRSVQVLSTALEVGANCPKPVAGGTTCGSFEMRCAIRFTHIAALETVGAEDRQ